MPKLGLSIKSFDVTLQPIRVGETMITKQRVATAVIHDEKSQRDVTLTHRDRVFTGTLFAFVAAAGETGLSSKGVGVTICHFVASRENMPRPLALVAAVPSQRQ